MWRRVLPFATGLVAGGTVTALYEKPYPSQPKDIAQENITEEKLSLYKYGKPDACVSLHKYKSHALAYDRSKKVPVWVMEVLSKNKEETADRRHSNFQPDPTLSTEFTATNSDYWKSGWSRGHMAASGNYKHCQESMNDTFYLTNVVPQNMKNNEKMEDYCRRLSKDYDEVRVISGPLFLSEKEENCDKKFVKYQVLGKNQVCVPTHLYKIIVAENEGDSPLLGAFVVPNKPIEDEPPLTAFKASVEDLEKWTGTKFLQFLQKHKCRDLCEVDGCQLMSLEKYSVIHYSRRISNAWNKKVLESAWTEMNNKGVQPDDDMKQKYKEKLEKFNSQ